MRDIESMPILPIRKMLDDAEEAWKIAETDPSWELYGNLACHIRALVDELRKAAGACAIAHQHLDTYGVARGGSDREIASQEAVFEATGPFARAAGHGFVSIYSWGFNSWGQAFLIMNLFHAVQYLALVWAMEKKRIAQVMRLPNRPQLALALYLGSCFAYGFGVQALDGDLTTLWAITMVVSLMHFWYDAFVWSVRRAQV